MRVQRIMCPIDFSESSMAALDEAGALAHQLGAQLLVMHVNEHPLQNPAPPSFDACAPVAPHGLLERMTPKVSGVTSERYWVHGNPCDEIPRFVQSHHVDLVVMGHHNDQERLQYRCDGVCDAASRDCQCPVMTVNHTTEHAPWAGIDGDGWSPL